MHRILWKCIPPQPKHLYVSSFVLNNTQIWAIYKRLQIHAVQAYRTNHGSIQMRHTYKYYTHAGDLAADVWNCTSIIIPSIKTACFVEIIQWVPIAPSSEVPSIIFRCIVTLITEMLCQAEHRPIKHHRTYPTRTARVAEHLSLIQHYLSSLRRPLKQNAQSRTSHIVFWAVLNEDSAYRTSPSKCNRPHTFPFVT